MSKKRKMTITGDFYFTIDRPDDGPDFWTEVDEEINEYMADEDVQYDITHFVDKFGNYRAAVHVVNRQ